MEAPQRLPPVRELLKAALKVDAELVAERQKAKLAASRASARKNLAKPLFGPPGTPRRGYRPTPPSSANGQRAAGAKSLTGSAGRLSSVSARGPRSECRCAHRRRRLTGHKPLIQRGRHHPQISQRLHKWILSECTRCRRCRRHPRRKRRRSSSSIPRLRFRRLP